MGEKLPVITCKGTLKAILQQSGLSGDEFIRLWREK